MTKRLESCASLWLDEYCELVRQPASEVYEVLVEETAQPARGARRRGFLDSLFSRFAAADDDDSPDLSPVGGIVRVFERSTGTEVFHHIEDISEGEGHLMIGLRNDLASMTAAEFKARWVD